MPNRSTPHLERWLDADCKAHAASKEMLQAQSAYLAGKGPPPSESMRAEVQRLREEAARLYKIAMGELDEISAQVSGKSKT
jgi:hypothetical protein